MNQITPEMYEAVCRQRDEARAEVAKYKDAVDYLRSDAHRRLFADSDNIPASAVNAAIQYIETAIRQ